MAAGGGDTGLGKRKETDMAVEPEEEILIKEELMASGVAEDVAIDAKQVFYTVRRYQNPRSSFVIVERFGTKETNPQKLCAFAANTTDCLRVLEEQGFIMFRNGRFMLTQKGARVR